MILSEVAPLANSSIVTVLVEGLIQVAKDNPVEGMDIDTGRDTYDGVYGAEI